MPNEEICHVNESQVEMFFISEGVVEELTPISKKEYKKLLEEQ